MLIIKKQKGFALITTILIFVLISFVIIATFLIIDTSDQTLTNTNKQLQAREICIAGLNILENSMEQTPSQFADILTLIASDSEFFYEVAIPFQMRPIGAEAVPELDNVQPTVIIRITEDDDDTTNKLIATATTTYGLTDTSVTLEILYSQTGGTFKFQKGRFLN